MVEKGNYCISLNDVRTAAESIKGIAHRTPVLTSTSFNVHDKTFFFKVEAMQRTGSFKFRGATNAIKSELETLSGPLSVVTHSSGNHAQAVALAAKMLSTDQRAVNATIVMPRNAPSIKQAAVLGYGAKVILVDNTNEAREEAADRVSAETGASFIHPSEDPRVIAGQGTASLELIEQLKELGCEKLDAVIIPVGGGGLAAGNTIALRGLLGDTVKVSKVE
jgi:threonine dehydratase